jgi:hypothetical protein
MNTRERSATTFVVTLKPAVAGIDGIRALRATLKFALRRFGLCAVDIREHAITGASRRHPAQVTGATQARQQEMIIMDMSKYLGSAFLKVGDVKAGLIRSVVADITEGKYGKPDVTFDDGTRLSLNVTNTRILARAYGTDDADWIGKEIELYLGKIDYQGEPQESILVKPISPPIEKKPPPKRRKGIDDLDSPTDF